jgi:hypothetical protein
MAKPWILASGVAAALVSVLLAPGSAGARPNYYLISSQGDDYAFNGYVTGGSSAEYVAICDGESDGHGVHADYNLWDNGTNQIVRDEDGQGSGNATGLYLVDTVPHGVCSFRAVEEIAFATDPKGAWQYPHGITGSCRRR